jgi:hypothetical protein
MEIKDKKLESFLKKAEADPNIMDALKGIVYYCQYASEMGIPLEEIAAAGTVGYTIGKDPQLKEVLKHLIAINQLGLSKD